MPVAAVAVAACLAACGTAGRSGDAPRGGEASGSQAPAEGRALSAAAGRVDALGRGRWVDSFAGLEVRERSGELVVYRRPAAGFDEAATAAAGGVRVVFLSARHSARQLREVARRILDDRPYWQARGVLIQSVVPRPDGSAVEVGTREGPADGAPLAQRYGEVTVVRASVTLVPGR
jgi:hypothetical protein